MVSVDEDKGLSDSEGNFLSSDDRYSGLSPAPGEGEGEALLTDGERNHAIQVLSISLSFCY